MPLTLPVVEQLSQDRLYGGLLQLTTCGQFLTPAMRVGCLQQIPVGVMLEFSQANPLPYQPVVDGHILTQQSYVSLKSGIFSNIPVVLGQVADEGILFVPQAADEIGLANSIVGLFAMSYPSPPFPPQVAQTGAMIYSPGEPGISTYKDAFALIRGDFAARCPGI